MYTRNALALAIPARPLVPAFENEVSAVRLKVQHKTEVLDFLAERPLHTVAMVGFIHDNGLVSPLNRGTFYGCRNRRGQLEGVALIGHATLMETTTDRALEAFAEIAQQSPNTHMIMGEQERVGEFWNYYTDGGQEMRLACRELLFELRWPIEVQERVPELRLAKQDDLELVLPIQAQMAFDESGLNPLERDPEGFRQRCARRIEQERTWVLVEEGHLLFKAETVSDTAEVTYLEGIWVRPEKRGEDFGRRCMSQLAQTLLANARSLCLLVNEKNTSARRFYMRAGYKLRSLYDTIFVG
jgi:GNAT superfamily N-acetyltransferase